MKKVIGVVEVQNCKQALLCLWFIYLQSYFQLLKNYLKKHGW